MRTSRHLPPIAAVIPLVLLASGCGGPRPTTELGSGTSVREARRTLFLASADGPVPLVVDRPPFTLTGLQELAGIAADATRDVGRIDFLPERGARSGDIRPRLVLRFLPPASADPMAVCRGEAPADTGAGEPVPRLQAVMCKGETQTGSVVGVATAADRDATVQLVDRTLARLFGQSSSSGGYGPIFPGVGVFGGVGGGNRGVGGGVGVGLGF